MTVSIVSSSFYESTFPLARALSENTQVDLYCVIQKSFLSPAMLDLKGSEEQIKCGIYTEDETRVFLPAHVQNYFSNTHVNIFIVVFSGGNNPIRDLNTSYKFIKKLKHKNYNIIHFIGTYVLFPLIQGRLDKTKLVQTLHESSDRLFKLEGNRIKRMLYKWLFRKFEKDKIHLIFHSENVMKQYLSNYHKDKSYIKVIPFGLFEGYKYFTPVEMETLPSEPFYLFIGYIHEYKGVDLIIELAMNLERSGQQIPFVIAGKDATSIRRRFKLPDNITLIDRYLTENEIVELISKAYAILLPYTSASQSGIPNTAFCFNKPIIASDLDGICDIVENEVNGLLFKTTDLLELEEKVLDLWNNKNLYNKLVKNINERVNLEWTDWKSIGISTREYYLSISDRFKG